LELSEARASAVEKILHQHLEDTGRTQTVGFGETRPIPGTDLSDEGKARNRRVELLLIKAKPEGGQ